MITKSGGLKKLLYSVSLQLYYFLTTLQVAAFYVMANKPYLHLREYLELQERNPYQQRILPVFILRWMLHSHMLMVAFHRLKGVFLPVERGAYILLTVAGLSAAVFFTLKLYEALSPNQTLWFLVQPALLYMVLWSYVVRTQSDFYYPYDMLSLGFFAAGIYFVYTHQYRWLLFIMALGTINRETTLFLIPLYIIDSCTSKDQAAADSERLRDRIDLRKFPWLGAMGLTATWLAIKVPLMIRFHLNDSTEDATHFWYNLHSLTPKHWPAILNICGYLLPVLVIYFRRTIAPRRFGNYMLLLPIWGAVMLLKGVLAETRIYGELAVFTALAGVLLVEQHASNLGMKASLPDHPSPGANQAVTILPSQPFRRKKRIKPN